MTKLVAGIDIGNVTTRVALTGTGDIGGQVNFLSSATVPTTGIKGIGASIRGLFRSLTEVLNKTGRRIEDLGSIHINEAAPVTGDVVMGTITETIVTRSMMIGHNPSAPNGLGIGMGTTIALNKLPDVPIGQPYIVVASRTIPYGQVAAWLNAVARRLEITSVILQVGDGALIHDRLVRKIPTVGEVRLIEEAPLGTLAAIEVANVGRIVETLSNPFGIATLFSLEADVTCSVVPLVRSLVSNRSAVIIRTPEGDVQERHIPAGRFTFHGTNTPGIDIDLGAVGIMDAASQIRNLSDIAGETGTNIGGMVERVWAAMAQLINQHIRDIRITDPFAVDTRVPQQVVGGIANESPMGAAVGTATMVRTDRLQTEWTTSGLAAEVGVPVEVGGVEADMAICGVFTTPGAVIPITTLDMSVGPTDTSVIRLGGTGTSIHLAGAGNMVTLIIQSELGLNSFDLAEGIRHHSLAKAESVFSICHEDGIVQFFEDPLPGHVCVRIVVLKPDSMVPLNMNLPVETIRQVRIRAKEQVLVTSAIHALQRVSPTSGVCSIDFVAFVGDSVLDFEVPQLITRALANYRVVVGRANIHDVEGPRNAVATSPVLGGVS